jgi:hypothetical protein
MRSTVILMLALLMLAAVPGGAKPYRGAEYRTIAAMTYGRFEVRMRSAQVSGMLASFFTFHDPASPWNEIDIETLGRYTNESQFTTIVPTQNDTHVQRQVLSFNPHASFHVYAIEWTPDYVAWRVDGVEVYRQTGTHIAQLVEPQMLMMNIWQPVYVDWVGTFNPVNLPVYAYYDWVKYYSYTPGVGDNFTLQWNDDFAALNTSRWRRGTHTWDGNSSQFVVENVVFRDGYMVLCLTDSLHSGYSGGTIVDADIDPPYLVSARASSGLVRVLFSELLEKTSAELAGNYVVPGATVGGASLLPDGRTVLLTVSGLNPALSQTLVAFNVKDTAGNAMGAKSTPIIKPLAFPIRIDVGGSGASGYLADSVWSFARQYGAVGGTVVEASPGLDIGLTADDSVYRSAVEGISFYNARVPTEGKVLVRLLMAETKYQEAGKRVFDVSVNGGAAQRVDLVQLAGANNAVILSFPDVTAQDGMVTVRFIPVTDKPVLGGIIIDPIGNGVGEGGGGVREPLGFSVFPNPLNGIANFSISLPRGDDVAIEVYDLLGRRVSSFGLGRVETGGVFQWDARRLASGMYLCSMTAGEQTLTRRILLVR